MQQSEVRKNDWFKRCLHLALGTNYNLTYYISLHSVAIEKSIITGTLKI